MIGIDELGDDLACHLIDLEADPLDLVTEEFDPNGVVGIRREDVDDVAAHPKVCPGPRR